MWVIGVWEWFQGEENVFSNSKPTLSVSPQGSSRLIEKLWRCGSAITDSRITRLECVEAKQETAERLITTPIEATQSEMKTTQDTREVAKICGVRGAGV